MTDSIIVFSNNSAQILQSVYPTIKNKIHVVPHTVKKYPRVHIQPHNDINIVVLGNMSYQKGADVVRHMANELPRYQNTNIIIIGKMQDAPKNIQVYGRYKTKHLPNIIKKYRADIIFIPSIWPETFSYTTSEAMSMGLPVACYDMGAPAERVKEYAHGLILKQISPSENLKQIIDFINNTKVNK